MGLNPISFDSHPNVKNNSIDVSPPERVKWKFVVDAGDIKRDEVVCVTADVPSLGNWKHNAVHQLKTNPSGDNNIWSDTVCLNEINDRDVKYRYCICSFAYDSENAGPKVIVKKWESNVTPRIIPKGVGSNVLASPADAIAKFGFIEEGKCAIENGWLTTDTAVLVTLPKGAIRWQQAAPSSSNNKHKNLSVKLNSIVLKHELHNQYSLEEEIQIESADTNNTTLNNFPNVQISVLNETECKFNEQKEYGHSLSSGEFITFSCRTLSPHTTVYIFEFFSLGENSDSAELIGHAYFLPNVKQSRGQHSVAVNNLQEKYIGQLTAGYTIIHPSKSLECTFEVSFSKYWKDSWKGLEIGHRGSGSSFGINKEDMSNIRENTIGSLKSAGSCGADMVEFDVQLSRDYIPSLFHDFHVMVSVENNKVSNQASKFKMPMQDLSSEELRRLKVYNLRENGNELFLNNEVEEFEPFPTLTKVMQEVDPFLGFDVEIKYSLEQEDGLNELDYPFDMNRYVDTILQVVFTNAGSRYILFSSFHPDICSMLRAKQNRYPVFFLTNGVTRKYAAYTDPRCTTVPMAVYFARSADILGVAVHAEDLLRDDSQVGLVFKNELILLIWGDDNNSESTISRWKDLGVHGIIYDKIKQLSKNADRKSVFEKEQFLLPPPVEGKAN